MTIQCWIDIKRNVDGVIRRYGPMDWHDDAECPEWIWWEGNFACDCNRDLFFGRAANPVYDSDDDEDAKCGCERYSVHIVGADGKVLYDEWENDTRYKG